MKVKLYITPTCAFCPMVKNFLEENGIKYEEVDISEDSSGLEEMKEKSGQISVPVTIIDDNVVIGFNKEKLSKFLGLK
jgi:glutaredoxin-like YruB-family protein